jgi:hypothetical protein
MTSPFVDNLLKPLALSRPSSPIAQREAQHPHNPSLNVPGSESKRKLQSLLLELNSKQFSAVVVNNTINSLFQIERTAGIQGPAEGAHAEEEDMLKQAIVNRVVVGLYAESLELCISQATETEVEAEWWADIERSRRNVAWYLFQSMSYVMLNYPTRPHPSLLTLDYLPSLPVPPREYGRYDCASLSYPKSTFQNVEPHSHIPATAIPLARFLSSKRLDKGIIPSSPPPINLSRIIHHLVFISIHSWGGWAYY